MGRHFTSSTRDRSAFRFSKPRWSHMLRVKERERGVGKVFDIRSFGPVRRRCRSLPELPASQRHYARPSTCTTKR